MIPVQPPKLSPWLWFFMETQELTFLLLSLFNRHYTSLLDAEVLLCSLLVPECG